MSQFISPEEEEQDKDYEEERRKEGRNASFLLYAVEKMDLKWDWIKLGWVRACVCERLNKKWENKKGENYLFITGENEGRKILG